MGPARSARANMELCAFFRYSLENTQQTTQQNTHSNAIGERGYHCAKIAKILAQWSARRKRTTPNRLCSARRPLRQKFWKGGRLAHWSIGFLPVKMFYPKGRAVCSNGGDAE